MVSQFFPFGRAGMGGGGEDPAVPAKQSSCWADLLQSGRFQTWLANVFLLHPLERKNPRQAGKGNSPPTTKGKEARRLRPTSTVRGVVGVVGGVFAVISKAVSVGGWGGAAGGGAGRQTPVGGIRAVLQQAHHSPHQILSFGKHHVLPGCLHLLHSLLRG